MRTTNKKYSVEFKIKAVELSIHRGNTSTIADELGIPAKNISRWKKEYEEGRFNLTSKTKVKLPYEIETIALKKALRDKEIENEILKKALRIFTVAGR